MRHAKASGLTVCGWCGAQPSSGARTHITKGSSAGHGRPRVSRRETVCVGAGWEGFVNKSTHLATAARIHLVLAVAACFGPPRVLEASLLMPWTVRCASQACLKRLKPHGNGRHIKHHDSGGPCRFGCMCSGSALFSAGTRFFFA